MKFRLSKLGQQGAMNILLTPLILAIIGFFVALGFGAWAFYSRSDYKNNVDQKIDAAVEVANEKLATEKDNEFLERQKYPLTDYQGPAQFGGIKVIYPKTWSAYILNDDNAIYTFNPKFISAEKGTPQALIVSVDKQPYSVAITKFESQVKIGALKAVAYSLPKVPNVVGVKFDGTLRDGKIVSLVILPLRDKNITIMSETPERFKDFNTIILPNISFSP